MHKLFKKHPARTSIRFFVSMCMLLSLSYLFACGDDDSPVAQFTSNVSISVSGTSLSEDGDDLTLTITLSTENTTDLPIGIPLSIGGTATNGQDYQSISNNLQIPSGSNTARLTIDIIDDDEVEGEETITISINTPALPTGISTDVNSSITLSIADNDMENSDCANDNSINQNNFECDETPSISNSYTESTSGDVRTITTNGIPNHDFRNQIPRIVTQLNSETKTFTMDRTPAKAATETTLTNDGRPAWKFGVATNGVAIDPAPAEPFIFENPNTGEFNFDWVFEPNWNMEAVGLDCAIAHVQPDGTYHYHGDMGVYADILMDGVSSGNTAPSAPVQIGWAADGFPIVYKYGPDAAGSIKELASSYQIKSGERPGDGITEPCGAYNGKYTNDFEFIAGLGDLDECNGVERNITLNGETFTYFYVITSDFPVISRCIVGNPDRSFRLGGG